MQGDFRLDLGQLVDALATQSIFWTSAFFLNFVADALEAALVCVTRQRICGIGDRCHYWWLFEVDAM